MSRDFVLMCRTCHDRRSHDPESPSPEWGRWCDLNHQGDAMLKLLPYLPLFASVARAGFDIDPESLGVYGSSSPRGIGAFALEHNGHAVEVFDEYGDRWPRPRTPRPEWVIDTATHARLTLHGAVADVWQAIPDDPTAWIWAVQDGDCYVRLHESMASAQMAAEDAMAALEATP